MSSLEQFSKDIDFKFSAKIDYTVQDIEIAGIFSDPEFNCRQEKIVPFDVDELAKDIERNGLTQPIVIQPWSDVKGYKYRVVVGHRRLQAFKNLKRKTIPAIIRTDLDETQARTLNLSENIQRKDLNVYQEAKAMEYFLLRGWSREEIAAKLEVSVGWVQIRATVLALPYEIQREIAAGFITQTQIKDIYALHDRDKMFEAVRHIKDQKLKDSKKAIVIKKPLKKADATKRKVQNPEYLAKMQEFIMDTLSPCLASRTLAWAAGNISTQDLLDDIHHECLLKGTKYVKPDWVE